MNHLHFDWRRLRDDERGFIVSIELILIATIAILGLIVGLTAVRDAVVSELSDVAGAIQDLNQCYSFFGVVGHSGSTCGSDYVDMDAEDVAAAADNCITFDGEPADEGGGEDGGGDDGGGGEGGGTTGGGVVIVRPPIIRS